MRNAAWLRELPRDTRGAILLVTAACLPLVIGAAGLAADTVQWALWKRETQRQADSGALAGAYALAQQKDIASAVAADLTKDADEALTAPPIIEHAPLSGAFKGDNRAVRVALSVGRRLPFSGMFLNIAPTISAAATARIVQDGEFCVISLENTSQTGIAMKGNATVDLGCGMVTNSTSNYAVTAGGSSTVAASPVAAVGNLQASSNYVQPTTLLPFLSPQPDPFASITDPTPSCTGANKASVNSNQSKTLDPGCFKGMDLKGTVKLNPGIYYVDGSSFSVGAQANVSGAGVTIVLTSSNATTNPSSIATIDINGGATMNLTAMTTGAYAGILIYQDRRATDNGQSNTINGNSSSTYQGAIYFPKQEIQYTGTTGMHTECLQLVARRVTFSGNSKVTNKCPPDPNGPHAFTGTRVKLVA